MSNAIAHWLIWPAMSCSCCASVHGCSLLVDGVAQNAQNHRARQRSARPLAQLSQQCHNPRGDLAALTLQVPSGGPAFPDRAPTGHLSYLSPLRQARAKRIALPDDRGEAVTWGRWMWCEACGFNGDRDYCASLNIARLGVAYLIQMKHTGKARSCSITDPRVKPVSYTGAGSALLLPPTETHMPARYVRGKICYCPGWLGSAFLQSSQPKAVFLRLCG